ncbi:hypothetical protein [Pandoraea anhela]|uniref:hypothetical protein n=1 Tax=Pandoraea anhela TaxID=2508295 RepID=UPI0012430685|nr:hypothetical protein [Pandoraea anhela]
MDEAQFTIDLKNHHVIRSNALVDLLEFFERKNQENHCLNVAKGHPSGDSGVVPIEHADGRLRRAEFARRACLPLALQFN